MIQTICDDYNSVLESIFGNNERVVFDKCHNDKDFAIRSQEREILCAIEKYHKKKYDINWIFRETMYGKVIITSVEEIINKSEAPDFNGLEEYYKKEFISRINMITNNSRKSEKIKLFVNSQNLTLETINYERCKELREQIEIMRQS